MSDHAFVDHLQRLAQRNRGALAELRRSLTFPPGSAPRVFPYVEPFIAANEHPDSARRQSHYLVAGLFALHPQHGAMTLAQAMGILYRQQEQSPSIEGRFIALLECDGASLAEPLRHAVTLLRSQGIAIDYNDLLRDLTDWLNPTRCEQLDKLRCRWATDFYRVAAHTDSNDAIPQGEK
ncbi:MULTISPECIES: type I-E CRISPR-associated protein Cse2/CasB [Edwardsiella]|uniref:type I-E CRISPR-associated protein Cse2/CasB n=1 Tax=Edwardsiella TaxID=635 RepID=UPI00083AB20C|nr:type I-E CRISPR-associated protein Cse2/CasB [Edwardsiella tarda]